MFTPDDREKKESFPECVSSRRQTHSGVDSGDDSCPRRLYEELKRWVIVPILQLVPMIIGD